MARTFLDNRAVKRWLLDNRYIKTARRDGNIIFQDTLYGIPEFVITNGISSSMYITQTGYWTAYDGNRYGSIEPASGQMWDLGILTGITNDTYARGSLYLYFNNQAARDGWTGFYLNGVYYGRAGSYDASYGAGGVYAIGIMTDPRPPWPLGFTEGTKHTLKFVK